MDDRPSNYIHLRTLSPIFDGYAYVDVPDYYADDLFRKHHVHLVTFGDEAVHPDNPKYVIIFAKCLRWEKRKFLEALKDLRYVMDFNGRTHRNKHTRSLYIPVRHQGRYDLR